MQSDRNSYQCLYLDFVNLYLFLNLSRKKTIILSKVEYKQWLMNCKLLQCTRKVTLCGLSDCWVSVNKYFFVRRILSRKQNRMRSERFQYLHSKL